MYASSFPIKELMDDLDLSLNDMSVFLDMPRSTFNKVLQKKKDLNGKQLLWISSLTVLWKKSPFDPTFESKRKKAENSELKKTLATRNTFLLGEIAKFEKRLVTMTADYAKILTILKKYNAMDYTTVKLDAAAGRWIKSMIQYWEVRLVDCNAEKQHQLKLKLLQLKQEVAFNTKALKA